MMAPDRMTHLPPLGTGTLAPHPLLLDSRFRRAAHRAQGGLHLREGDQKRLESACEILCLLLFSVCLTCTRAFIPRWAHEIVL